MPKIRILMEKIREILRLCLEQKMSLRSASKVSGVSKTTIGEYLAEFKRSGLTYNEIINLSDDLLYSQFENSNCASNKKYEELSGCFPNYEKDLKRSGVTLYRLWEEYKGRQSDGFSYSRFCHHYMMWAGKHEVYMHMEYKGGEKMFVDFAGKKQHIVDKHTGEIIEVEVFVAILASSQLTYVEACKSQEKEEWVRVNENALQYFGGVPRAIVPDNLKSGITKACKYEPIINETFRDFAMHYGTVILPARPYKPKDKSFVESAVNIVYQRVYAPLRNCTFFSIEELNDGIWRELEQHNNTPFQKRDSTRRELFEEIERQELLPLPLTRYEMKEFLIIKVQFNYHVYLKSDRQYYSVPYIHVGKMVKVTYTYYMVDIYFNNERVALHRREKTVSGYTTKKEHMPPGHQFISGWDTGRFLRWSERTGETTHVFIQRLLESKEHPEQAFKACMGVLNLSKKYDKQIFEWVCKNAIELNCISYRFIDNSLKNKTYMLDQEPVEDTRLPEHINVRGREHYK